MELVEIWQYSKKIDKLWKQIEDLYREDPLKQNIEKLQKLNIDLQQVLLLEEYYWKQCSRANWFWVGDANTKFIL